MSTEPTSQYPPEPPAIRDRTAIPGMLLLIVGLLNLLFPLRLAFVAIQTAQMTDEQMEQMEQNLEQNLEQLRQNPSFREALEQFQVPPPEELRRRTLLSCSVWAGISLVAALLVIVAGLRMRALRSFGLVVMGALTACIPCVTCSGCCGLGEIAGVWALVVLFNPEVRQAFR